MDIQNILLVITALFNLLLGLFIFVPGKNKAVNCSYSLFCLFIVLWTAGLAVFRYTSDPTIAIWAAREYYIAANFIGSAFLYFSLIFPDRPNGIGARNLMLVFLPNTAMALLILFVPGFLIKEVVFNGWGNEAILDKMNYAAFAVVFLGTFSAGFYFIFKNYLKEKEALKKQLLFIFIGCLLGGIFGTVFNLVYPWIGNYKLIWLGPPFTIIMVISVAYAIMKHNLMDIKVVATKVLTTFILVILFGQMLLSKDSSQFIMSLVLFLIMAIFGYMLIRAVTQEVKNRERIEKLAHELEEANVRLKQLDSAKSEFLSLASHQLRTPLSIIKGFVSMLLEESWGKMNSKQKEHLGIVYESNERLVNLVDDLLNISRIESGKMQFNFQPGSVEELAQSAAVEFKMIAARKKLDLIVDSPKDPLPQIKFDSLKLRQVIINFIDNSIKYTSAGKITVKTELIGNDVVVRVEDTGMGFDPADGEKFFQKFSRSQETTRFHTEGLGLGLYLAAKIIQAHGGKIWAESKGKGMGSAFCFSLPAE